ncbi:MAG: hypothetical protein JJU02_16150 [Cryomorphaceae bacterium]|nr:hypothetical protein [Cryomorphaceae bacterium]
MRIQKSTDKEDFGRKGLFRADSQMDFLQIFSCKNSKKYTFMISCLF